ncbi:hypothetical protein [Thiomicrorhabdus sp. Milos-T2]|nr:hypothetical protein [Thiomicrorhabdus sp. Milos-T2]
MTLVCCVMSDWFGYKGLLLHFIMSANADWDDFFFKQDKVNHNPIFHTD